MDFVYNDTDFDLATIPSVQGPHKNTEIVLKLVFYSLALLADCLLLFVMFKDPLKRFGNSTSYFITNLAVSDLVSILAGMCQSLFQTSNQETVRKSREEIASCFSAIGEQCSFLIIMIFAIDRYLAIGHPYRYKQIVTKTYVLAILLFLPWCFSAIALPVIYFAPAYENDRSLTNLFAGDIIVLAAITILVHPLTHWQFKRKLKRLAQTTYTDRKMIEENLKIAKVLASTVLLVGLCLIIFMLPYFVVLCFSLTHCDSCLLNDKFLSFWSYYPLLRSIRLLTNSLVYAWRLPLYRTSLRILLLNNVKCLRPRAQSPTPRNTMNDGLEPQTIANVGADRREVVEMT